MVPKPKVIVILGPTASGKSDLAVTLAKKFKGEVISADSRQVYKGLDIGTGKITKKEMKGVSHHLLDVASPKKQFTVAQYKKLGEKKIKEILGRKHVPIICGGTGFYIDTLLGNFSIPEVKTNVKLRKELGSKTTEELVETLEKLDPERASSIDVKNRVRLVRAIEIAKALGKVPALKKENNYDVLKIGISFSPEVLKQRIKIRLNKRIKQGMIQEAQRLHKEGLSWKRMEELGLEYRYLALYLQKKLSKEEMIERLNAEIWHYAKRQMTWFKKDKSIQWIEMGDSKKAIEFTQEFLALMNQHLS